MSGLRDLPLDISYSSGTSDLFTAFYVPCLSAAIRYNRAVGYFRSSLFVAAGLAFSDFAQRGGKARLVCSPSFTLEDLDGIRQGVAWREMADIRINSELHALLQDVKSLPATQFLATLIGCGALELRIAVRPASNGIFHDKLGLFGDLHKDWVSFVGSANETLAAWDPRINHEGFEVFKSWGAPDEALRVERHSEFFDSLWSGQRPGVTILQFPDAARNRLLSIQEHEGVEESGANLRRALGIETPVRSKLQTSAGHVRVRRVLQEHQQQVVESWEREGRHGIISHVTGAGKTVSALEIIRRWVTPGRPALIVVPSELLVRQWKSEIEATFPVDGVSLLIAGAGSSRSSWEGELSDFTRSMTELGPRIILATMQTAGKQHFTRKVNQGEHLLLVADEVHRLGAPSYRDLLWLKVGASLGLSATPKRYGDSEGSSAIHRAFGAELQPLVDIPEAIRIGRLVPYDYFVHRVSLTDDEDAEWKRLSEDISRLYARLARDDMGLPKLTQQYEMLLFKRARVIKRASGKIPLALSVLQKGFKPGDRWLVYCDDIEQLRNVTSVLRTAGLTTYEYYSAMDGSRDATMAAFAAHEGVLVAIKCLDEGVDVPVVNKALILASSANPREFIQRRGRVLRKWPDKFSASIHDALVLPPTDWPEDQGVPSYAVTDLSRATEFARHARNTSVLTELKMWAAELGLQAADLERDSFEEEEVSLA